MAAKQPAPNRGPSNGPPYRQPPQGRNHAFQRHDARGQAAPNAGRDGYSQGRGPGRGGQMQVRNGGRGDYGAQQRGMPQQRYQQVVPNRVPRHSSEAESSQQGAARGQQQHQQQIQQRHQSDAVKTKKRPYCWRCKCGGHSNEECKADLDCIICNKKNSHLSSKCPILKMPKPTAAFLGSGKPELGFLRINDIDYKLETPDPSPTALVRVSGGKLSAEVVQAELARLTRRGDWKWEALPHGVDSFLVGFPSDEEIQRMADIDYQLKNHGVTLAVSNWQSSSDITPTYQLDEVWVHISGVPHAWRHYLVFWALGSVIGATLDIDMLTYRRKGVIRILVGMLNRDHLPYTTDVVFGTEGYDITFSLEDNTFVPAIPSPADQDPMDRDDKGEEDKGPTEKENGSAVKKQKNGEAAKGSTTSTGTACDGSGMAPMQHQIAVTPFGTHRPIPPYKPLVMMNEHSKLSPIAVTIPRTASVSPISGKKQMVPEIEMNLVRSGSSTDNLVAPVSPTQNYPITYPTTSQSASSIATKITPGSPCSSSKLHGTGCELAGDHATGVDKQNVANMTMPTSVTSPTRPANLSLARATPQTPPREINLVADEDSMAKAMRRAAIRNLDGHKDTKTMVDSNLSPHSPSTPDYIGYPFGYALAPYMGYSAEANFAGFCCSGLSTIGAGGQGIFYPGTWVAV